jgi:hypothetical protein
VADAALLQLYHANNALVRELASACQADRSAPGFASGIGKALQDALRGHSACCQVYQAAWEKLAADEIDDDEIAGMVLWGIVDGNFNSLDALSGFTDLDALHSYAKDLGLALAEADKIRQELRREWPWIDRKAISQAMEAYERGEWDNLRTAFGEMQDTDTPSDS